ncbi:hypothetical protein ACIPW9_36405 [Streptomyces sp. NPDC090052]|uniref:hypothetical protein n=1 Tax=Streptomyces sp. NPDC090052 TaxID=3365931 RepID=UPI00380D71BB
MAVAEPLPGVDQYVDRLEAAQRAGLAVYLHTLADRIRATTDRGRGPGFTDGVEYSAAHLDRVANEINRECPPGR